MEEKKTNIIYGIHGRNIENQNIHIILKIKRHVCHEHINIINAKIWICWRLSLTNCGSELQVNVSRN